MIVKTRDKYWDIVKCIGIICIVLGHVCGIKDVIAFVYLFHLPLFFFISGYLFSKEKWQDAPGAYVGTRFMSVWPRYMVYTVILVLMHNFFVKTGAYPGEELYNNTARVSAIVNSAVFAITEKTAGAMWFIPVWLGAQVIFVFIVYIFRNDLLIAFASAVVSAIGVVLHIKGANLQLHMQTALVAEGFMAMGYFLRRSRINVRSCAKWWGGLIAGAALYAVNRYGRIYMDMSANAIHNGLIYITGAVGIYLVLCLAELISKCKVLERAMAFIGRYTLDIMALHFAVIKLTDIVYVYAFGGDADYIGGFPSGYAYILWPLYLILSLVIPAGIGYGMDKLSKWFFDRRKLQAK